MEGLIAREIAVAKELIAAKKRERALLALKKKRLREGQLEKIDAYLLNVEQARCLTLYHADKLPHAQACPRSRQGVLTELAAATAGAGKHRGSAAAEQAI